MDEKKLKPCAQSVLAYMIDYGSITVRQAVNDLGTTELLTAYPVRIKRYRLEGNHGASA